MGGAGGGNPPLPSSAVVEQMVAPWTGTFQLECATIVPKKGEPWVVSHTATGEWTEVVPPLHARRAVWQSSWTCHLKVGPRGSSAA